MGHEILTGSVVFVWRVEAEVGHLASVETRKSLHLMCKARVLIASLHELSPDLVKLLMTFPLSLLMTEANFLPLRLQFA